jgi:tyrosyl-tRNA synthetase
MDIEAQVELLMQGTEYGDEDLKRAMTLELRARLVECQKEARALRVYCGYDPTATDLHLGHTITMRSCASSGFTRCHLPGWKLYGAGWRPSDKNKPPLLTEEQVNANARPTPTRPSGFDPKKTRPV